MATMKLSMISYRFHDKRIICFAARIHPGEVQGSYMLKGIINKLIAYDIQSKQLLDSFVFKIFPI